MARTRQSIQSTLLIAIMSAVVWLAAALSPANAEIADRPGWVISPSSHPYLDLTQRVANAAKRQKVGVIFAASASIGVEGALGKKIPGNMVLGLFHPRFAVRMLESSIPAGIEAPIRIYITENPNGTGTISYKKPSFVFAPYYAEATPDLAILANELDDVFDAITKASIAP